MATKGEEQVAEAGELAADLADKLEAADSGLAERYRTLAAALDEVSGHVFVKGILAVPFTAAARRQAQAAQAAWEEGQASAAAQHIEAFEAAVVKLQGKTTGTGGIAIT
jgi:hypothetical protein